MLRSKGQWGDNNKGSNKYVLPVGYETNPSLLYKKEEIPFMGVLYHDEEDYRDNCIFTELLHKFINADIKDTLNMSFNDFIKLTPFEMSMVMKVCETHKEAKISAQEEQSRELEEMQKTVNNGGNNGI